MSILQKKLRQTYDVDDSHGSWAISYGDLVTILLSFFIIFFSTDFSSKDKTKIDNALIESMNGTLFLSEPLSKRFSDDTISIKKINKDNFLIFFKNTSFFEAGRISPNKNFHKEMSEFVVKINPFLSNYKLIIHAYTDSSPVQAKHRFNDNVELSGLRAISVKNELEKLGIESNRMEISGKGILSEKVIKFMGISLEEEKMVKSMQRTVAFVVRREQISGEEL